MLIVCFNLLLLNNVYEITGVWDGVSKQWPIPPYFSTPVPYTHLESLQVFPDTAVVDEGQPVETLNSFLKDSFLKKSLVCDVKKNFNTNLPRYWAQPTYSPAICTDACHLSDSKYPFVHDACQSQFPNKGKCCPVNEVPFFSAKFTNPEIYRGQEPERWNFYPKTLMSSGELDKLAQTVNGNEDKMRLQNPKFISELMKERVCGVRMRKEFSPNGTLLPDGNLAYTKSYIFYFCMESSQCLAPHMTGDLFPERQWHTFCRSNIFRTSDEKETLKSKCCQPSFFPDDSFTEKLKSWAMPEMPYFLKYAPGVRSNFMCEQYSQYLCNGTENPCKRTLYDGVVPSEEFPHLARLGIIAPKTLLYHCLGSVISRRFILSTWTCREFYGIKTNIALLGSGLTDGTTGNERQYFIGEIRNPYLEKYVSQGNPPLLYEPSLYKTNMDIEFSFKIHPACLYYQPEPRPVAGFYPYFGKLGNSIDPKRLKRITLKIPGISGNTDSHYPPYCRNRKKYTDTTFLQRDLAAHGMGLIHQFCSLNATNPEAGPCKHDEGGSLTQLMQQPHCMWQIIGVLSSRRWVCDKPSPFVFHNITYFVGLIEDIVWPLPFLDAELPVPTCERPPESYWNSGWDK